MPGELPETMHTMRFFDIGVNLTSSQFKPDLDTVLTRARQQGVIAQVITGTSLETSRAGLQLAEQHGDLFATAGIHPHHASEFSTADIKQLETLLRHPRVLAVGETGLDFNRDFSPRDQQESVFQAQLELAGNVNKPVFLHQRDAHQRFLPMLANHRERLGKIVVHCFTGNKEELFSYLDLDCYIGITGWLCDKKRGKALRDIVQHIPNERLLIETDAPYLIPHNLDETTAPAPIIKKRNEPAFITAVLQQLAICRQQNSTLLATHCLQNSLRFFALDDALVPMTQAGNNQKLAINTNN